MSLNPEQLRGRVCVVTGAARSIGLDIATRYASYGAKVYLLDYSPDVEASAQALREQGGDAQGVRLDVTDHDQVIACFDEIVEKSGPIYALVNCAGVGGSCPFEQTTPEMWHRVLNVNLLGTVNCIQGAIRSMRQAREGKIINFSSKAGKTGSKLMTVYGASKGAIITLTQALAQEYAEHNVHVNCVCPDIIKGTGMWDGTVVHSYARDYGISEDEVNVMYEKKVPLGHFATMEDVTDVVCFYTISGEDCTGQSINITGGRFMH